MSGRPLERLKSHRRYPGAAQVRRDGKGDRFI
jgi:hypothetical protein